MRGARTFPDRALLDGNETDDAPEPVVLRVDDEPAELAVDGAGRGRDAVDDGVEEGGADPPPAERRVDRQLLQVDLPVHQLDLGVAEGPVVVVHRHVDRRGGAQLVERRGVVLGDLGHPRLDEQGAGRIFDRLEPEHLAWVEARRSDGEGVGAR